MSRSRDNVLFAKRSFSQNFLIDQSFVDKIVGAAEAGPKDTIVEIGPGRGSLTEKLLDVAREVIAIELDRDLAPVLRDKFAGATNFRLVEGDAVNLDFGTVLSEEFVPAKLVANLPYNVSTAILQSLATQKTLFSQMILMFQREVAERISAKPGTSERGFLTVVVEANFEVEQLFDVPPTAFRPVPKVWSSVVKLTPRPVAIADNDLFRKLVSAGFSHRRKTLQNTLKTQFPDILQYLNKASIDPSRRAETLTLDEWLKLARTIS